ncbi:MAG TPA: cytochrome c [Pyrinomonadaceae bacterium]|nr:cytochrome c [Pyrinomonadaceae bacterium]
MKLISLVLSCAVIVVFSSACTETATPTNTPSAARSASPAPSLAAAADPLAAAQANYQKHCEACHGPNGEGGLVKVEDKQIKVASLKSDHAKKHSDDELTKIITAGEEEMPGFKDKLNAAEITDLVRYVRHHFQGTN